MFEICISVQLFPNVSNSDVCWLFRSPVNSAVTGPKMVACSKVASPEPIIFCGFSKEVRSCLYTHIGSSGHSSVADLVCSTPTANYFTKLSVRVPEPLLLPGQSCRTVAHQCCFFTCFIVTRGRAFVRNSVLWRYPIRLLYVVVSALISLRVIKIGVSRIEWVCGAERGRISRQTPHSDDPA